MHLRNDAIFFTAMILFTCNVHAYVFHVDNFSVNTNGSTFFNDDFADGSPPPSAPNLPSGSSINYFVNGTMGPEADGKLTLDSSDAAPGLTALGDPMLFQSAILNTGIDTSAMLTSSDTITIQAIYDLTIPAVEKESYGINFTDRASGLGIQGDDIVGIRVIDTASGISIQFFEASFSDATFNPISSVPLDTAHDQIMFELNYDKDAPQGSVTASYAYIDDGIMGAQLSMNGATDIFNGEDWTRAQFVSRTVVPVPAAAWLFATGLIGLLGIARRMKS
jgi:hypothetical protein